MRSKEERKNLHRTPQKLVQNTTINLPNASRIVKSGEKIYQETKIDGKTLYVEVKTSKE